LPDPRVAVENCLGCRLCQIVCPVGAVGFSRGRLEVGPACLSCAACLEVCPAGVFAAPE